ncbi:hypothetical protein PLA106_22403 [Pseudomonas amygdali pv. lachrymans str. M302278]|nr:hypothetical protein PLA106_22403 [Pseudomonas amygdali pv. lachrymans str. M302278]
MCSKLIIHTITYEAFIAHINKLELYKFVQTEHVANLQNTNDLWQRPLQ